jgi:Polyketide cyclase / dehydrase and lipid transport
MVVWVWLSTSLLLAQVPQDVAGGQQAREQAAWEQVARSEGVSVYSRPREDSSSAELRAVGLIEASPHEVWAAIREYDRYADTMPHTAVSRILATDNGGRTLHVYQVITAPLIERRDYLIRVTDESDWRDGEGFLKVSWSVSAEGGPPPKQGMVRMRTNDGYWLLEPRDGGTRTFATYYVHADPGGAIPAWLVNLVNKSAVPGLFVAVRRSVAERSSKLTRK